MCYTVLGNAITESWPEGQGSEAEQYGRISYKNTLSSWWLVIAWSQELSSKKPAKLHLEIVHPQRERGKNIFPSSYSPFSHKFILREVGNCLYTLGLHMPGDWAKSHTLCLWNPKVSPRTGGKKSRAQARRKALSGGTCEKSAPGKAHGHKLWLEQGIVTPKGCEVIPKKSGSQTVEGIRGTWWAC